jgi:hypothetical protein
MASQILEERLEEGKQEDNPGCAKTSKSNLNHVWAFGMDRAKLQFNAAYCP